MSVMLALLALAAMPEPENFDIFPGTLSVVGGEVVLRRCSLGGDVYVLRDAKGGHAVADYAREPRPAMAQVIGAYAEERGRNVLYVRSFEDVAEGKTCHLGDALDVLPADAAAFVGHYYLSGLREVGAELMLGPDGRFGWAMSYGAVDQAAQGRWYREKGEVVLVADAPPKDKPLLAYRDTVAWNRQAEEALGEQERDAAFAAMQAQCPFDTSGWAASAMARPMLTGKEDPAVMREKAAAALARAQAARGVVEVLARKVMALPLAERAGYADTITQALQDWLSVRDEAQQAAFDAGQALPELAGPQLPAACTPVLPKAASDAAGLAVLIEDPETGRSLRGLDVALRFADGRLVEFSGSRGEQVLLRGPFTSPLVEVALRAAGQRFVFAISPVRQGVVRITVDGAQLSQPAFDRMRLRIDGAKLAPEGTSAARYTRQP